MKTKEKPAVLRDMNPTRALAYCANITNEEWRKMETDDVLALWSVFRSYILNGYQGIDTPVPARIAGIWDRCKLIIDKEVTR